VDPREAGIQERPGSKRGRRTIVGEYLPITIKSKQSSCTPHTRSLLENIHRSLEVGSSLPKKKKQNLLPWKSQRESQKEPQDGVRKKYLKGHHERTVPNIGVKLVIKEIRFPDGKPVLQDLSLPQMPRRVQIAEI
jgi:hypothetical protein